MFIQLTSPANLVPLGYQQLTNISTSTGLTVPDGACLAWIQAEAVNARFRDDGTAPTASVGMILVAGTNAIAYIGDLSRLNFIQSASGTIVNITYFGLSGS